MRALLLLCAAALPVAAQCTYSVSQSLFNLAAPAYNGQVAVNTSQSNCTWRYASDVSWITFPGSTAPPPAYSGQGAGTAAFTFIAAANPVPGPPNQRVGHIQVTDTSPIPTYTTLITISQDAPACALSITPATAAIGVAGGPGNFAIQSNCLWAATNNPSWIAIAPANGSANATLNYTAVSNPCVASRTGAIVVQSVSTFVGNQVFALTQDGSPANLSLSPATFSAPSTETSGSFAVTTGAACGWTAFSDVSWLAVTSSSSGAGNNRVGFKAIANTGGVRTGGIHVGGQVFTVTQAAVAVGLTSVIDAASGKSGAISPGEILSLFGSNMGPATGVPMRVNPDGTVQTRLSGTRVLFDGREAAITYTSATQVNAVAPYTLVPGSTTQLQVEYQGVPSASVPLTVQAVTPAVFTISGTGAGQAAILNQDTSVNDPARPAARGDIVAIFATGAGATTPASVDAALAAAPYPSLAQPLTVTIGGVGVPASSIVYKGAAPGAIAGLTQINVRIPDAVPSGSAVPIVIAVAATPSQSAVTMAVK